MIYVWYNITIFDRKKRYKKKIDKKNKKNEIKDAINWKIKSIIWYLYEN